MMKYGRAQKLGLTQHPKTIINLPDFFKNEKTTPQRGGEMGGWVGRGGGQGLPWLTNQEVQLLAIMTTNIVHPLGFSGHDKL
jgi:hypothetical protein